MNDREEWICANIGLVHACAKRFTGRGMEYDDLFQAGCMGLVKAADGFDESRGLKFSTYAVPVILGEMRRLFRDGGTVKVSRSLKELALRATREREGYIHREGREPTIGELADLLGVDAEQAAEALGASLPPPFPDPGGGGGRRRSNRRPRFPAGGKHHRSSGPSSRCWGSWIPGIGLSSCCGISIGIPSRPRRTSWG